ncbi:MAG: ATP-binding cassette domain-containing protein [Planctomycetes bacterium]|nr:ATP-binding cassette domain-containing protein [Planctomycetota bacterium]MCB9905149.1 ATP-binding cassette domain-containing protein [Planctomycetota bacterium]
MTVIARATGLYRFHEHGERKEAVLRGIDLDISEGEFVCVMGPSGSGKSTLLHLLAGLDQPSAGHVTLGKDRLDQLEEPRRTLLRRRTIGHVFQFFHLLPNLSVIENVGLPIAIEGGHPEQHEERLGALLATLGLAGREDAMAHELSGGEMQRVSIARALAGGQPLLLCDEPTGNLSQKAGLEVMQILRRLRDEERRSILLVTHNPRDATFADRVLFLVDGELAKGVELQGPDLDVERVHETLAALSI